MKLLIEIPKEVLKTRRYTDFFGCGSTMLTAMLDSGTPLDDVLDEIKTEFKSKADGDDWYHTTDGIIWEEAIEIIDKYRAESE